MTNIEKAKEYLDFIVPSREYQKRRAMASMLGFSDIADRIKDKHKNYLFESTTSSMYAYLNTDDYAEFHKRVARSSKLRSAEYLKRVAQANTLCADDEYFVRG